VSVPFSYTRGHESWRCQPVQVSETFCVLVAYTEAQKALGASKEPKAMRFAVQPNAKVEQKGNSANFALHNFSEVRC
jgi:hypothetical protein